MVENPVNLESFPNFKTKVGRTRTRPIPSFRVISYVVGLESTYIQAQTRAQTTVFTRGNDFNDSEDDAHEDGNERSEVISSTVS